MKTKSDYASNKLKTDRKIVEEADGESGFASMHTIIDSRMIENLLW